MIYYKRLLLGGMTVRVQITLRCTECNSENYHTTKNKKEHPERLETKKYCPKCNTKTLHRQKK
jgi:large subunit ribosomal protein L33